MSNPPRPLLCSILALPVVAACLGAPDSAPATTEALTAAAAACPVSGTDVTRALAVTTPTILARFGFTRVMTRLRATASIGELTNTALFQTWMKTFGASAAPGDCNDAGLDPNHYGLVCPRVPEAKLATVDPFAAVATVTYQPVGLFNRFDLAPASGAHCGEYRIVYAMSSTGTQVGGRSFLIFEAALPNPTPSAGLAACLPVAQFWADLSADPSDTSRAAKLEKFYFTGGAVAGFPAVVDAHHYGLADGATAAHGAGQVRTNMFIDNIQWQLREFKLRRTCTTPTDPTTCTLRFDHVTVKTNPANEVFGASHARSAAFHTAFPNQVAPLARASAATLGMSISDAFNELESVSHFDRNDVVYTAFADAPLRAAIQAKLTAMGSSLTVNNILDRATTQTCAGCHEKSNGAPLGGGVIWPPSMGFVQIDEGRNLSPALRTSFLPRRKAVLEAFLNSHCAALAGASALPAADSGLTIGGSPEGAAN